MRNAKRRKPSPPMELSLETLAHWADELDRLRKLVEQLVWNHMYEKIKTSSKKARRASP